VASSTNCHLALALARSDAYLAFASYLWRVSPGASDPEMRVYERVRLLEARFAQDSVSSKTGAMDRRLELQYNACRGTRP
jgi:hypothetical protein